MALFSFLKRKTKNVGASEQKYSECDMLCATLFSIVNDLEAETKIKSTAVNDLTLFAALAFLIDPVLENAGMRDKFIDSFGQYTKIYSGDNPRGIALVFRIVEDEIEDLKKICDLKSADDIELVMFDAYISVTEAEQFADEWFEKCDKKFEAAAAEAIKWALYYTKPCTS